ncbi:aldose 1-epimerase family protein [Seonamhaeicola marinus]|uniref:Aldose 1-epimerase family protein n=1 Tax=Seonamhaeicola marinus TaxID=1912246 RepID=A0A5D0I453_9FLAO|nr:aldose 1-epimerase family protein [Seonamhaeicola marinus]TYA78446.1 aldose 1-epimerase family protein [Seonamhaeicola marinus]
MHLLENDLLKISVKPIGAELCSIRSIKNNTEFMWQGDPDVWGSHAPNLFPIIGMLKEGKYIFNNKTYSIPKHGFIRHNPDIKLIKTTYNNLTYALRYSQELLKDYPFKFEFHISYTLKDDTIEVKHEVKNLDDKTLYFSVGGHPAFKCPVFSDENYNDYTLEFAHEELADTYLLNKANGLVTQNTKRILNSTKTLPLEHRLFEDDALIFKNLKSRKVTLKSVKNDDILSVAYKDFDYLGIWAKTNGDFICIEPWLGITDNDTTNQELTEKEGILSLAANKTFEASYYIEINKKHL